MSYRDAVNFENTQRKMEHAGQSISFGVSAADNAKTGLSLTVVKREDKTGKLQTTLFIETTDSSWDHEMNLEPDHVAHIFASHFKIAHLCDQGHDAVEKWIEDAIQELREDTDDDYREDNPRKSPSLTAAQDAAFQEAVCDVEQEAGSDGYSPLQRRAGKAAALKAVQKHRDNMKAYAAARSAYFYAAENEGNRSGREGNPSHSGLPLGSIALGAVLGAAAMHFGMKPKQ